MLFKGILILFFLVPFAAAATGQPSGFLGIRAKKGDNLAECAVIEDLAPGGPGQLAGLAVGDVISGINGVPVDCAKIQKGAPVVSGVMPGDRIVFRIVRGQKKIDIPVVAGEIPDFSGPAAEERSRLEAGRAVLDRLVRTQEVFTVTLIEGGGFEVTGKMTGAEAEDLHFYFEKKGDGAMFPKAMKTKRQDMYLRFDREKGAVQYEFVDPAAKS